MNAYDYDTARNAALALRQELGEARAEIQRLRRELSAQKVCSRDLKMEADSLRARANRKPKIIVQRVVREVKVPGPVLHVPCIEVKTVRVKVPVEKVVEKVRTVHEPDPKRAAEAKEWQTRYNKMKARLRDVLEAKNGSHK